MMSDSGFRSTGGLPIVIIASPNFLMNKNKANQHPKPMVGQIQTYFPGRAPPSLFSFAYQLFTVALAAQAWGSKGMGWVVGKNRLSELNQAEITHLIWDETSHRGSLFTILCAIISLQKLNNNDKLVIYGEGAPQSNLAASEWLSTGFASFHPIQLGSTELEVPSWSSFNLGRGGLLVLISMPFYATHCQEGSFAKS